MPRVLVLGANGRLGRSLRRAWTATEGGVDALPFDLVWQTRRAEPAASSLASGAIFDPLAAPEALAAAVAGADAVLNLAGPTGPDADHSVHAALASAILTARGRRGTAPILLLSSAAVYGRGEGPLDEETACLPVSAYGRGKLAMEDAAGKAGGAVCTLRLGNVAGSDALLGRAASGAPVTLDRFADGATPVRAYIGPVALARVLAHLLGRSMAGGALPAILNVAAGQVSMASLLDAGGFAWTPRPASADVIREVRLATGRLDALVRLPTSAGTPAGMVAEWQALAPAERRTAGAEM